MTQYRWNLLHTDIWRQGSVIRVSLDHVEALLSNAQNTAKSCGELLNKNLELIIGIMQVPQLTKFADYPQAACMLKKNINDTYEFLKECLDNSEKYEKERDILQAQLNCINIVRSYSENLEDLDDQQLEDLDRQLQEIEMELAPEREIWEQNFRRAFQRIQERGGI